MNQQAAKDKNHLNNTPPTTADNTIPQDETNMKIKEAVIITPSSESCISFDHKSSLKSEITPETFATCSAIQTRREKLEQLQKECNKLIKELDLPKNSHKESELIVKRHIQQLKQYNELKDVALSLVSLIADQKQVRIKDILDEMEISPNDD